MLGRAIAQGVKADLAQSRAVQIVDDATIAEVLRRMERGDGDGPLTRDVARDAAQRAGAKMVVDGSVRPLGAGFLVSLSLVTADSGREVVTYQASVDSPGELIGAVGRLTRKLRARIGESLRDVRASPRLEAVTTPSLAALRKYTEARWALYHDLNQPKFVRLMREAIALDTSFAMAYQALAQELSLRGNPSEAARLIARAYPLRERLPAREQRLIEYGYFRYGPREVRDAARSHAAILAAAADPSDRGQSLNTVGSAFEWTGQFAQAESVTRLAIARDSTNAFPRGNLFHLLMQRGRLAEAESLHADFRRRFPAKHQGSLGRGEIALMLAAHGLTDSAEATLRNELAGTTDPIAVTSLTGNLGTLLGMLGRVREYEATMGRLRVARRANGLTYGDLVGAVNRARYHALTVGDRERARHILDSALARGPTDSVDALDRPNASLATAYAAAGDPASARRHLAGVEQQGLTGRDPVLADQVRAARAYIAIAERRWDDAIREARLARAGNCQLCGYLPLALAYDGRGDVDSAIAVFERTRADLLRYELNRGPVLRRLGELYEAKGDLAKAIDRYERFVALWRRADPELQPQVAEVRARVARLQAREGRTR
jgi:tetratricopeptide (TPR) repeat protein